MPDLTSDQDEPQDKPDPNIYQPEEGEEDESEIDRRIRRSHERLRRLTIVGSPDFNTEAGCLDVLTVEGGFDTGYAVQYQDCASGATSAVIGTGACCFNDGSCVVETEAQCLMNHGIYLGDNTTCDPNPCISFITGACCFNDGTCEIETEAACNNDGGDYQGNGTSCTPNPCVGACCFPDGTCSLETSDACMNAGGTFQGIGTDCDPNPCMQPCNGCGFPTWDGSPGQYKTLTTVTTGSSTHEITGPCPDGASSSYQETSIQHYNTDCSHLIVTQFGHHNSTDCNGVSCSDMTYTTACVRSFCAVGCSTMTTITPTVRTDVTICDDPGICHAETTIVRTLSDQCTPP